MVNTELGFRLVGIDDLSPAFASASAGADSLSRNADQLSRNMTEASASMRGVGESISAAGHDATQTAAQFQILSDEANRLNGQNVNIQVDTRGASEASAAMQAVTVEANRLDGRNVNLDINARGAARAAIDVAAVDAAMNHGSGSGRTFASTLNAVGDNAEKATKFFPPLLTGILAIAPAIVPIAGAALYGTGALVSMGTLGGAGIGIMALAIKDAVKYADKGTASFKLMSQAQKDLTQANTDFGRSIQDVALPIYTTMIGAASDAIRQFAPVVRALAPVFQEVANATKNWVDRAGGLSRFLDYVKGYGVDILKNLADAGRSLLAGLGDGLRAFAPAGETFSVWLKNLAQSFRNWADGGGFQRFIMWMKDNSPKLKEVWDSLKQALPVIVKALGNMSGLSLSIIMDFFKIIAKMNPDAVSKLAEAYIALSVALRGLAAIRGLNSIADSLNGIAGTRASAAVGGRGVTSGRLGAAAGGAGLVAAGSTQTFGTSTGAQFGNVASSTVGGALSGAAIGTMVAPGLGTAIGAGAGGLAGLISGLFTNPKVREAIAAMWSNCYTTFIRAVGSPVAHWFTTSLPDAFTKAIPHAWSVVFEGFMRNVGSPIAHWFDTSLPQTFTRAIPSWFKDVGSFFNQQVIQPISRFITVSIPGFFTQTIPQWFRNVMNVWQSNVTQPIQNFITNTLPSFFTNTIPRWFQGVGAVFQRDVLQPIQNFVTNQLPGFFTSTIPRWFVGVGAVFQRDVLGPIQNFVTNTIPGFFTSTIPRWFSTAGQFFQSNVITPISNFVTNTIPGFFTSTIPRWFSTAAGFFQQQVITPVSNFVTNTIPGFFTSTIPRWFSTALGFFQQQVISPVQTFVTSTLPNFFTSTIPRWFSTVLGFWQSQVIQPLQTFVTSTLPNFFTSTIPRWFSTVVQFFTQQVIQPVQTFVTQTLVNFFTSTIPRWFSTVVQFFQQQVISPIQTFVTNTLPNFFTSTIPGWFKSVSGFFTNDVINPIKSFFTNALPDVVKSGFQKGMDLGKGIINSVIGAFNTITGLSIPKLAQGGIVGVDGFAAGGQVGMGGSIPGYGPGQDTVMAMLSPGEGVLTPEAVLGIGGPGSIDMLNATFAGHRGAGNGAFPGRGFSQPGFQGGGTVSPVTGAGSGQGPFAATGQAAATGGTGPTPKPKAGGVLGFLEGLPVIGGVVKAVAGAVSAALDAIISSAVDPLLNALPNNMIGGFAKFGIKKLIDFFKTKAQGIDATAVGGVIPSGNHLQIIDAALAAAGVPPPGVKSVWEAGLNTLISRESGWNAGAINTTDSNAAAGHPSQGLAQVIPSTFAAYHVAGTSSNILDPVANVAAAIRYIVATYGNITNVQQANANLPPKGYSLGGMMGFKSFKDGGTMGSGPVMVGDNASGMELIVGPQLRYSLGGSVAVPVGSKTFDSTLGDGYFGEAFKVPGATTDQSYAYPHPSTGGKHWPDRDRHNRKWQYDRDNDRDDRCVLEVHTYTDGKMIEKRLVSLKRQRGGGKFEWER